MDNLPYLCTEEQRIRSWLRAHRDDYRSPVTGRRMAALLAHAAAEHWGITERSPLWAELMRWTHKETR